MTGHGMQSIGAEPQSQQSFCLMFAEDSRQPKSVYQALRISLTVQTCSGHSRRSLNTRMSGFKRMEKKKMEPMHARAFLTRLLSAEQRNDLRAWENRLPPGRSLQGFEIVMRYQLQPKPILESQIQWMGETYRKWLTSPDNNNNMESTLTHQQKIHQWEDFAIQNYVENLPEVNSGWNTI